jgi:hypothetical protein
VSEVGVVDRRTLLLYTVEMVIWSFLVCSVPRTVGRDHVILLILLQSGFHVYRPM